MNIFDFATRHRGTKKMYHLKKIILILAFSLFSCDAANEKINDSVSAIVTTLPNDIIAEPKDSNIEVKPKVPLTVIQLTVSFIPDNLKAPNQINENGQRTGKWINFYDANWDPIEYTKAIYYRKVQYKNGKPFGKVQDFYINGYKQWEGKLLAEGETDILDGICSWYNHEGIFEKRNNYCKGVLEGKETEYYENGKVKIIRSYSKGVLSGKYVEYYLSGEISQSGKYDNGTKTGKWRYYDEDGDYKLTEFIQYRVGAICNDGSRSYSTGRGTCSHHGGVNYWLVETEETVIGGTGKFTISNYEY